MANFGSDFPVCYGTRCDASGALHIILSDGKEYTCPLSGGTVSNVKTGRGTGTVYCPPAYEICDERKKFCNGGKGCNNAGSCGSDGVCVCFSGRTGDGCEDFVCPKGEANGAECSGNGACNKATESACALMDMTE